MDKSLERNIRSELKLHAKALGIPSGAAKDFIAATIASAQKQLRSRRSALTTDDVRRIVTHELAKYHADLAYVYQNRDTII